MTHGDLRRVEMFGEDTPSVSASLSDESVDASCASV